MTVQAEKFSSLKNSDDDDSVMDEDSLLETPLDKMEPYGMFRDSLLSRFNAVVCRLSAESRSFHRATTGTIFSV